MNNVTQCQVGLNDTISSSYPISSSFGNESNMSILSIFTGIFLQPSIFTSVDLHNHMFPKGAVVVSKPEAIKALGSRSFAHCGEKNVEKMKKIAIYSNLVQFFKFGQKGVCSTWVI